jgi:hypothetical protein
MPIYASVPYASAATVQKLRYFVLYLLLHHKRICHGCTAVGGPVAAYPVAHR